MITRLEVNNYRCLRYNKLEIGNLTSEEEVHILNEALFLIPRDSEFHSSRNKEVRQREMFPVATQDAQETLMVAPGKRKSPKGWRKIVSKTETGNDYFGSETALTYLIEEPENGIHPKALETVMQALTATNNVQVLLATHSPLALALLEPKQMLCFAKNSSGATDIVSGINHPVLKNWQGEIPIETLFASGVLA